MLIIRPQVEGIGLQGRSMLTSWDSGALEFYGMDPRRFNADAYWRARRLAKLNGHLRDIDIVENLIVNAGLNLVLDVMIADDTVGFAYHAIGTTGTTPVATNVSMNNEVARKPWQTMDRTGQVASLSTFYLASESTYNIAEEGVWGGATASGTLDSGELFAHYLRPYDNSLGTYDLTFDYDVTAARG